MAAVTQVNHFDEIRIEGPGQLTINQIVTISVAEVKTRAFVPSSPYLGLRRFEERNKEFFFGRDRLVEQLLQLMSQRNLVLVAGPSGSGKSSVVRAGLLPLLAARFAQGRFRALVMTPDRDPFSSLRAAMQVTGSAQSQLHALDSHTADSITSVLTTQRPADERWLLLIDQFEEIFTLCTDADRRETFLSGITQLAQRPQDDLKIVLAMRADFFDRFGPYPAFGSLAKQGLELVLDMEASELRAAIEQPAAKHGVVFEAGLVEQIIADVKGRPGALPLVQYTLDLLWRTDNPRDDRTLSMSSYLKIGGIEGALRLRADAMYRFSNSQQQTLRPKEQQALMRQIFLRVVDLTSQGAEARVVSRRAPLAEFTRADEQQMINELADEKLLVTNALRLSSSGPAHGSVEIAHESLLSAWPLLKEWLEQAREVIYVRNRLSADAHRWMQVKQSALATADEELWGGTRLQQAQELHLRDEFRTILGGLRPEEQAFLDSSVSYRERWAQQEIERLRKEKEAEAQLAEEKRQKEEQKLLATQALARRTRRGAIALCVAAIFMVIAGALIYRKSAEARQKTIELKMKETEVHDSLLFASAKTVEDPTEVASLLREMQQRDSARWAQTASAAIEQGIAASVLRGHGGYVRAVAFNHDGSKLVTGSFDKTARIWNSDGLGDSITLAGHTEAVYTVAFCQDGKRVVTGSADHTARIWSVESQQTVATLTGHADSILFVACSRDGQRIATASADLTVRVWNADGTPISAPIKHQSAVNSVAFSSDGKWILTGAQNGMVSLFAADDLQKPTRLTPHPRPVYSVAFSPDGTQFATGCADGKVRLWSTDGPGEPQIMDGHRDDVYAIAFSPDGRQIISGSKDRTARIWNRDRTIAPIILRGHGEYVNAVAWSPDRHRVATTSPDATVRIWDLSGYASPVILSGHTESVTAVAASRDGETFVTASADHTARIYRAAGPVRAIQLHGRLIGHLAPVTSVAISSDGKKVATGSKDRSLRIWDTETTQPLINPPSFSESVTAVAFSADGRKVVTGCADGIASIWNTDSGTLSAYFSRHPFEILAIAYSRDGKKIATGSVDRTARVWNVDRPQVYSEFVGHEYPVNAVAFTDDGTRLITGSGDHSVRIWNIDKPSEYVELPGHEAVVRAVALSPDKKSIAVGYADQVARILSLDRPKMPLVLAGHHGEVNAVAFTADSKRVITGSTDGTARIWIVDRGALQSALWDATNDCIPEPRRVELLLEDWKDAKVGVERCRQDIDSLRQRSMPAWRK